MQTANYFVAAIGLLILAYLIFRVLVRRDYRRHGRLAWGSISLELLIFALHANFSYLYLPVDWPALPSLPQEPVQRAIGLGLIAVGFIGVTIGMTGLGFRRVFGRDAAEINRSGLYGFTRNPQILAYGFMLIGFAVLWPAWYALGSDPLLVLQVGRVPIKLAGRTRDILASVQAPVAGVILNDKSGKGVQYYGYYGRGGYAAYGYGYEDTPAPKKRFWRRR